MDSNEVFEYFEKNGFSLVRLPTSGDSNACGFHSVLQAYYLPYIKGTAEKRRLLAARLRKDIGANLRTKTSLNGHLEREFEIGTQIEDGTLQIIAEYTNKNIFLLTRSHLSILSMDNFIPAADSMHGTDTVKFDKNRTCIFIVHDYNHYSTVALEYMKKQYTHFSPQDPLVEFVVKNAKVGMNLDVKASPVNHFEDFVQTKINLGLYHDIDEAYVARKKAQEDKKINLLELGPSINNLILDDKNRALLEKIWGDVSQVLITIEFGANDINTLLEENPNTQVLADELFTYNTLHEENGFRIFYANTGGAVLSYLYTLPENNIFTRFYLSVEADTFETLEMLAKEIIYRIILSQKINKDAISNFLTNFKNFNSQKNSAVLLLARENFVHVFHRNTQIEGSTEKSGAVFSHDSHFVVVNESARRVLGKSLTRDFAPTANDLVKLIGGGGKTAAGALAFASFAPGSLRRN